MYKADRINVRGAAVVAAVGIASWFGGSTFQKYKISNNFLQNNTAHVESKPRSALALNKLAPSEIGSSASTPSRTSEIMKHGFPSLDNVRSFEDFILAYDRRTRIASWVFEHLTKEKLKVKTNVDRSKCEFTEDQSIHHYFRATNSDYRGSGFDRGHLAAAGNHRLQQSHCDQTFILSNIAPQVGVGFNRDYWNKLEKHVRRLTKNYKNVYVCTGPLFMPVEGRDKKKYVTYQVLGKNNVAVPTHFFKVVLMEDDQSQLHLEAYMMPNQPIDDKIPLSAYQVPLSIIEKSAGLIIFGNVSVLSSINGK